MEKPFLEPAARCPLCGEANGCSMAGADDYKGPCWCKEEVFPDGLLGKIPEELRNVACICRSCVVKARRAEARAKPLPEPRAGDFYVEKELIVFTEQYHRRRGYCCGGGCRHCPFDGLERELALSGSGLRK